MTQDPCTPLIITFSLIVVALVAVGRDQISVSCFQLPQCVLLNYLLSTQISSSSMKKTHSKEVANTLKSNFTGLLKRMQKKGVSS